MERLGTRGGISVGAVIQAAIDAYVPARQHAPEDALKGLFALEGCSHSRYPVDDWADMKAKISKGGAPGLSSPHHPRPDALEPYLA